MGRNNWTRDETILALSLYCKIPFAKIRSSNKQVIELAKYINRTPSAVAMKMCNFARFDPELNAKGVTGLKNGSRLDGDVWYEFYKNMESLYNEVENIIGDSNLIMSEDSIILPVGDSVESLAKSRRGQAFFRSTVLSAYDNVCCVTGLNIPALLQASHIKSWKDSDPYTERTNPVNGLCLNALHHEAFDNGLITIDVNYNILVSPRAKQVYSSQAFYEYFERYDGLKITLPSRFLPSQEFIEYHNSKLKNF